MAPIRTASRADIVRFCETEGWVEVRNIRGGRGHHQTFELALGDGRILWTRVSHSPGRIDLGTAAFAHILKDQLDVTRDEFWACVDHRKIPDRGSVPSVPDESIPVDLVYALIYTVGVPEDEVHTMSRVDAIARMEQFWSGSR